MLFFCGASQSAVLYEQTQTGTAYDITKDVGNGSRFYSVFPFWSGSGPLFPGSGGLTLAADARYLRIKRLSGLSCETPALIVIAADDASNIIETTQTGQTVGDYCDYPLNGTSTGKRLWTVIICFSPGCNDDNGTMILDGSTANPGFVVDGSQTIWQQGGWAFQLCDIDGCTAVGGQKTPTGFYWPTGTGGPGNHANFLAMGCYGNTDYLENMYHIGKDFEVNSGAPVIAVSDGEVESVSYNGWGKGNIALVVRHWLYNGLSFYALYGHVQSNLSAGSPVSAGDTIATVGPYGQEPHLHFGVNLESIFPRKNYGKMPCNKWPNRNGFVEPVNWITTQQPGVDLSGGR